VPDCISAIIAKGEYPPLYYNPGELANEVHILMVNSDAPDKAALQHTVGRAQLTLHNLPARHRLALQPFSLLNPWLLRLWAMPGVRMIRRIKPDLIRCHDADWCGYLACRVKAECGVPYCISFHGNPDVDYMGGRIPNPKTKKEMKNGKLYGYMERLAVCNADRLMPVYAAILPFFGKFNLAADKVKVCYNVLNSKKLSCKKTYELHDPIRLLWVNRMCPGEKNPENIIRALAGLDHVQCTLIGDGPLRRSSMELAKALGVDSRARFIPSMSNDDVCSLLPEQDIFVIQLDTLGITKGTMEALLTGLPVVINRRIKEPATDCPEGGLMCLVDNTPEGYREAIRELITNHAAREALGRQAFQYARARWDPEITEAVYVNIYRELLERHLDGEEK